MKIISCGLPLPIQRLYIKRLKHMIQRWECSGICGHCPILKHYKPHASPIKEFEPSEICEFCEKNVGSDTGLYPCNMLDPPEALKRAKDFIERFEKMEGRDERKNR